ncbi:MAG: hypothetical protein A3B10_02090 [Candidatus Doudnabacteria bacterium RIFCSPLOWO2_01_FULL_44_21]|uniref:Uncharacterized protein n=1 Tax=Candidatus Doudnabacteria bacterium RIFCSPLOWO2_01_FULL_44_21 TaxID=1817841 RepID=A0A1F5Q5C8_9BACT|nr:MAG: hypothetical protein A3B95_00200 [Candidatus Doudnabacteria bacterium RIFCSPHIGHO2_02_FULL_43_13b]OGE97363.1 MAG: hypothetical protein A3B10_02090 [Candidatus Doudnabacteria bacterium RIFCSPLOWO2_01_FULL_44_21]
MQMLMQPLPALAMAPILIDRQQCEDDFTPRRNVTCAVDFIISDNGLICPRVVLYSPHFGSTTILFTDGFRSDEVAELRGSNARVSFERGEPGCPEAYVSVLCGRRRFEQMVFDHDVRFWFRERHDWEPVPASPNEGIFL